MPAERLPNAQINVAAADSPAVRVAARMRRRMYEHFVGRFAPAADETLLDVGVTSDDAYEASNYLEAWYPHRHHITAVGIDDASSIEHRFPGVRFVRGDGCRLPFADRSFDLVHSSAVIEHVGDRGSQRRFIAELARVARRGVFLTTPNRWYPLEFHTLLPLVHWLPRAGFHAALRASGRSAFASERVLNLLTASQLRAFAADVPAVRAEVSSLSLLGWPSNLMLSLERLPR